MPTPVAEQPPEVGPVEDVTPEVVGIPTSPTL